jgi:hypothetical protein
VVKRRAELAGMDPSEVSGHSLRAGLATAAAAAGVQETVIAQTPGHKSMTVLRATSGKATCSARTPHLLWVCREFDAWIARHLHAAGRTDLSRYR